MIADVCNQPVHALIGEMARQYLAALLNTCPFTVGAQGPLGGVDPRDSVNLNRLPDRTRAVALAVFGTPTPVAQQVLDEAERVLGLYCDTATADSSTGTMMGVLSAIAQEGPASIIEPA